MTVRAISLSLGLELSRTWLGCAFLRPRRESIQLLNERIDDVQTRLMSLRSVNHQPRPVLLCERGKSRELGLNGFEVCECLEVIAVDLALDSGQVGSLIVSERSAILD